MMNYYKPRSLTWWAGVTSIAIGILMMFCTVCASYPGFSQIAELLSALNGGSMRDVSPVQLVLTGLIAIGLRAAMPAKQP